MDRAEHDPNCLLCRAERVTPWRHEDDICWIADCYQCRAPMVVWKQHGTDPPESEREHMMEHLTRVGEERFGESHGGIWFDAERRSIPDHFHVHARPKDGFFGPGGRPRSLDELR